MPEQSRLTRRSLLKRAGAGAALLAGTGFLLERTLSEDRPRGYLTGFNDDFLAYSATGFAGQTMQKVRRSNGTALRFGVNWGQVQAAGPRNFDFTPYNRLYGLALHHGLQLLPTVFGCPDWAGPVMHARRRTDAGPAFPDESFRTCSPEHDHRFGHFVAATMRHFDTFSMHGRPTVIQAAEIFNEPNLWTFGEVPADRVRELANAAAEAVAADQAAGAFSVPMSVISGGLGPVSALQVRNRLGLPPRISWQQYLRELLDGPVRFDVGIHSYESGKPPGEVLDTAEENPSDQFSRGREYADWQADQILDRVDQTLELAPGDVWITETGASSAALWPEDIFSPAYRNEFGQRIQAEVLAQVAAGVRSRPRCRAMIVHRLFSNDQAEPPPGDGQNSAHFQSGIYESVNGQPKLAVKALAENWA